MDKTIIRLAMLMIIFLVSAGTAHADMAGYAEKRCLRIESKHYIIIHVHDWTEATRELRFKMISTHKNPFTPENNYASITCISKASGEVIFKLPCPALTQIAMSPDEQYILGLSNIKLWNPYQFVVFSVKGALLKKLSFSEAYLKSGAEQEELRHIGAHVSESVTNWVEWFDEADPAIRYHYKNNKLEAISLLDAERKRIRIGVEG